MSNTTDFTGLTDKALLVALKGIVSSHLPKLDAALAAGNIKWSVTGNRLTFRFAPNIGYRREQLMKTLWVDHLRQDEELRHRGEVVRALKEQVEELAKLLELNFQGWTREGLQPIQQCNLPELETTYEESKFLEILCEAQEFRSTLVNEASGASWNEIGSDRDEAPRNFPGLQLYIQDWWTSTMGKQKRVHAGIELCFVAAEAPKEEPEAADAPGASHWGEDS